ncbi:MAG: TonB-dependent receptor [Sphingobacteriales bacterium]|nr:MAG: TonB-dependent receptor [Sphingobacteriales bacterium]
MYKFFLLVSIYILISIFSFAAKISGTVNDATEKTPLEGVLVVVKELNKYAETDSAGVFVIDGVESGTYEVIFSLLTFKELHQTVSVLNNRDVNLSIALKGEGTNKLGDVTIRATRATSTENAVMMEIRKSHLTVSGISAAQISKTADRNAADVVRRLPGVTIFDDRFIVVRGLHDRYNTVWLNDAGAPSSETDKKSFSFDLIPSVAIDRMLVYKTPAPELPGDFAGGMVKVYTSGLPERNQVNVDFQTSYRANTTGKDFYYNTPSKTDWLGYDDGKRAMPVGAPDPISKNDSNNAAVSKSFGKNDWAFKQKMAAPDVRFKLKAANVFNLGRVKLGNTFALSYTNVKEVFPQLSQNVTLGGQDENTIDEKNVNDVNLTLMDNIAAIVGNSRFEFKNLLNQTGSSRFMYRTNIPDSALGQQFERSYMAEYESRRVYTSQLGGLHKSSSDRTKYNWTLGFTDVDKTIPDLRRIKYFKPFGEDDTMYMAGVANVVDPVNGGGRYFARLKENVYSFNHHFSQKIRIKDYTFEASAGNFIEYKSRTFSQRVLGYTLAPTSFASLEYLYLPIDQIFADSNVGGEGKFRMDEITAKSDKYDAQNRLIASYIAVSLPYKDKITASGGVRYEHNVQKLQSFVSEDSISPSITSKFWLPSFNIGYNINEKMILRVAYGKTLNRPEFREWAPLFYYDMDNRWGVYGSLFAHALQDTLKVTRIQNYDLRWEWYPNSNDMIHAGVFYKTFKDPIQFYILNPGSDSRQMTYINTKEAYSAGVEVDIRKNLSFVDDWLKTSLFKDFSIVGNLALLESKMKIEDSVREIDNATMQGQSPYMINGGLYYQNDKNGFQGSFVYNVYGPRMIALGDGDVANIGERPFHALDAFVSKTLFKHYTITIGAQNILNNSFVRVQDQNKDGKYAKAEPSATADNNSNADNIFRSVSPGRYYSLGVKVKF